MARTQGTNARTQRLTALVATLLLALTTGFAIGRVFLGHAATYQMVVTALLSAGVAVALERRNLLLATLASAAAMVVVVGFIVFPETTWHGLPTLETLRSMVEAAGLVGEQARVQVAPTEPLPPLMLAALAATWASVFSAHALAFRAGSPLLSLLPPIALVAFADSVLEDVVRPLYGLAFLVAALAVVFADGLRRVQGWGPVWSGPGRQARLSVTAGRGARRVAAAAIALAAVSPVLLPGFGSKAILDFSSKSGDQVRIDPLVSVQASLNREDPTPVFEVRTPSPSYWRMVALPDFDGTTWRPDLEASTTEVERGDTLATNAVVDPAISDPGTMVVSFRTSSDLALPWLPMPYPPISTDLDESGLQWDPETGGLGLGDTLDAGVSYSVTAQVVRPSPDSLRAEDASVAIEDIPARYVQLPDDMPPEIEQLALQWTQGAVTTYDKAIALQEVFTSPSAGFVYDASVQPRDDRTALVDFLSERRGFCQQFASAMAVMLRSLGIPARVAVGFTAGQFDDSADALEVTTEQAHAWVEVFFPHYGWLAFEPTPGRQNVVAYPYLDPTGAQCQANRGGDCGLTPGGGRGGVGALPRTGGANGQSLAELKGLTDSANPLNQPVQAVDPGQAQPPPEGGLSARAWLLVAVIVLLAILAAIPPVRAIRRGIRVRRAGDEPRRLILTTYDVFTERAAELGFPRAPGQTMQEYRDRVFSTSDLGEANGSSDLGRLTSITVDAAYAPREPSAAEATDAVTAADDTLRSMRRTVGWTRRLKGIYLPR